MTNFYNNKIIDPGSAERALERLEKEEKGKKEKEDSLNQIVNMVARHKEVNFVFDGKAYHIKELKK